jgi:glycosyltransferase involved in cell wall biosynthesis
MKVLRITTCLNFGGVERNFELHAKYHRKQDYELVMVALENGGRAEQFIKDCGIRVITLGLRSRIPSLKTIRRLVSVMRKERPDVIHTACAEGNFHGLLAGWLAGVPVRIGEEIGVPGHSRLARNIFSFVYGTATRVYGISNAVSKYLAAHEVNPKKLETIYYPIDSEMKMPVRKRGEDGVFVIATVCRLEEVKNLPVLLDMMVEIRKNHPERKLALWFVGDGSQREMLEQRTKSLGLSGVVKFWGYQERPLDILVDADLFVLPSHKEAFGLACIEAIQCNVPVVVTKSGGMVEYIQEGVHGFLFDPKSTPELIEKVEHVITMSPADLDAMKKRASSSILELFAPDKYLDTLNRIYRNQRKNK